MHTAVLPSRPMIAPLIARDPWKIYDLERRTAVLQQAHDAPSKRLQIEALISLWRIWHCRLPLVEAQVGWTP